MMPRCTRSIKVPCLKPHELIFLDACGSLWGRWWSEGSRNCTAALLPQDCCPALFLLTLWAGLLQKRKFMPEVTNGDEAWPPVRGTWISPFGPSRELGQVRGLGESSLFLEGREQSSGKPSLLPSMPERVSNAHLRWCTQSDNRWACTLLLELETCNICITNLSLAFLLRKKKKSAFLRPWCFLN